MSVLSRPCFAFLFFWLPGDINYQMLQVFVSELMTTKGPDLFRYKGLLSIKGAKERYVFQVRCYSPALFLSILWV